jgi:hypothetical protein
MEAALRSFDAERITFPALLDRLESWAFVALGALVISLFLARHFGRLRSVRHSAGAS